MTPYLQDADCTLYCGDVIDVLRTLPDESVHMCCTSPPFYGLRDYGTGTWEGGNPDCDHVKQDPVQGGTSTLGTPADGGPNRIGEANATVVHKAVYRNACGKCGARRVDQQIGLEATPDLWTARLVEVFREVRRVLRSDGTLWVEIGDSYNSAASNDWGSWYKGGQKGIAYGERGDRPATTAPRSSLLKTCKPKDLIGAPWQLAFALRADGWYLRSEIIWAKPNPMPESVTDRPTVSHSRVFLLSKSPRYFYDAEAIREPVNEHWLANWERNGHRTPAGKHQNEAVRNDGERHNAGVGYHPSGRNRRTVWTIPTEPYPDAHFATWPQKLCEPMILAGTSERGVCPECGAPWERVVEQGDLEATESARIAAWDRGKQESNGDGGRAAALQAGGFVPNHHRPVKTTGWQPTCSCCACPPVMGRENEACAVHDALVPATVLDPFAGSGTTLFVARRLGRRSIGIELNPEYCALAARRLAQQSLEFA